MSKFTAPADLRMLQDFKWELLKEFTFLTDHYTIVVPAGFVTDLASVPRIFWNILPPYGEYGQPAIVHDYLYSSGLVGRKEADDLLLEGMVVMGVARWRRYVIYAAVRLFGGRAYKTKSGAR